MSETNLFGTWRGVSRHVRAAAAVFTTCLSCTENPVTPSLTTKKKKVFYGAEHGYKRPREKAQNFCISNLLPSRFRCTYAPPDIFAKGQTKRREKKREKK